MDPKSAAIKNAMAKRRYNTEQFMYEMHTNEWPRFSVVCVISP